ncbi:MAG: TVP38/TMEM64 family protein, partial [Desulfobacterales bacterium]
MEETPQQPRKKTSKAVVKAIVFVVFIIAAIILIRFTSVKTYLTADALGSFLETAGLWAPILYMVIYAVGVCLFLPGTLLTGLGAAIFGAYWGFLYVWIGAMMGASA